MMLRAEFLSLVKQLKKTCVLITHRIRRGCSRYGGSAHHPCDAGSNPMRYASVWLREAKFGLGAPQCQVELPQK